MSPALLIVSILASSPVSAEPPAPPAADYALTWDAPAQCPDRAEIERRISALTAGREDGEGTLVVDAVVSSTDTGFALAITTTLRGETGRREVSSSTCESLADTLALVVAVSLDPAVDGRSGPAPDPEPAVADPPTDGDETLPPPPEAGGPDPIAEAATLEITREPTPHTSAPTETSTRGSRSVPGPGMLLRLGLGPEIGALPGVSAAIRVGVGLAWTHARVLAVGTYLTPRRTVGPDDATARYQQGMAALIGCGRLVREAWSVPLCAGVEAGGLRAVGLGGGASGRALGPWLGPLGRVGVARELATGALWLDAEAVGRGVGTRVSVDEDLVFRPSAVSLRVLAGFEISWR